MRKVFIYLIIVILFFILGFIFIRNIENKRKNILFQEGFVVNRLEALIELYLLDNFELPSDNELIKSFNQDYFKSQQLDLYSENQKYNYINIRDKGYDFFKLKSHNIKNNINYKFKDLLKNEDLELISIKADSNVYEKLEGVNLFRNNKIIKDSIYKRLRSEVLTQNALHNIQMYNLNSLSVLKRDPFTRKKSFAIKYIQLDDRLIQKIIYSDFEETENEKIVQILTNVIKKYEFDSLKIALKYYVPPPAREGLQPSR